MKRFKTCSAFLLIAILTLAGTVAADRLEMKDGRVLVGEYRGGSRVNIHFRVDGQTKIIKVEEVSAIYLGEDAALPARNPTIPAEPVSAGSGSKASRTTTTTSGGTVPAGTRMLVRMIDGVDSEENAVGDTFRANLDEDLTVDGTVVAPKGADVVGRLAEAKSAGKFAGKSELRLELTEIIINGRTYPLVTGEYELAGKSRGKDTAVKVGAGAAIGAVVGAIAGGGKGAAIGAGVGAGAGTAIQVFTKGEQVRVPSETVLEFTLEQELVVRSTSSRRIHR